MKKFEAIVNRELSDLEDAVEKVNTHSDGSRLLVIAVFDNSQLAKRPVK